MSVSSVGCSLLGSSPVAARNLEPVPGDHAVDRRVEADAVLERIAAEGPLAAADFENGASRSGWWEWSDVKHALEWLFWSGRITTATRRGSFARLYDLTERVIPQAVMALPTPSAEAAQRARALLVPHPRPLREARGGLGRPQRPHGLSLLPKRRSRSEEMLARRAGGGERLAAVA